MVPQQDDKSRIDGHTPPSNKGKAASPSYRPWLAFGIALIVVAAVLVWGILSRVKARTDLSKETAQEGREAVSVVSPKKPAPAQEIVLPGNIQPFINSPVYSRTNGYLTKWYFDIGAHVKQGQLLAVIETPEVDQQLAQSISNLDTAKANLALAETTKNRYQGLVKDNAVSQQDVDNAVGTYNANKATVEANQANVKQLQCASLVREDLRALRRSHYSAKHRHWRPHQFRQHRRREDGSFSHRSTRNLARLCQRA